jgi:hypothetical protein
MYKSLVSLALSGLLFQQVAAAPQNAPPLSEKESRRAEKVKVKIAALGTGEKARVRISLRSRDRRGVSGYIKEAGAESFTVVEPKTGVVTVIPYSQVKAINPNRALPVLVTLGVGVGIIVTVVAVALAGLKGS